MENYKNPLFSFCITDTIELFYLDGILLSPFTWKGLEQWKEGKKIKNYFFKYFFTLKVFDAFNNN